MIEAYSMDLLVSSDLIFNVHNGHNVIFDTNNGKLYTLNKVADEILRLIQKGKCIEEISISISNKYKVTPEKSTADVKELIERMVSFGIIRR